MIGTMKADLLFSAIFFTTYLLFNIPLPSFSQGTWNPPGADLSFPRTLLDTGSIDEIRQTLANPTIIDLYHSIWLNANKAIPGEDTSNAARENCAEIAKEAAFVVLMNKKWENNAITGLSPDERDSLISRTSYLLKKMNTRVGFQSGWVFYQEWQFRSKELISYLIAYDLLRGAGINDQTARDSLVHFTGNLYHRAMATYTIFFIQLKFFTFQFNNHTIMTASALGLAAVVLGDHTDSNPDYQPINWINAGLWNVDNTLWVENGRYPRVSEPDTLAGYAEGPHYFNYAFQNAFPFIRSLWNFLPDVNIGVTFNQDTRQIRNPWYNPSYDRLYDWMNRIRMPDGGEPAIHDCEIGFGTTITSLSGKPEFNLPNPAFSYDDPFIRTQYISTNVPQGTITDSLFQSLPAAGSLCFRSSWSKDAICLHSIGKHGTALTGAKSHHHGDAGSFSLMAFGQLMAVDPGYPGASQSYAVNKGTNHSLVLVDGYGPLPPAGEYVNTATNTAFIGNTFHTPRLDYGEIHTNYWTADVVRKILFVRGKYFFVNDFLSSPNNVYYTFQFHGNGLAGSDPFSDEGTFIRDPDHFRGTYSRDSVHLLVQVEPENSADSFQCITDSLACGSLLYRHCTTMKITKNNCYDAHFQSLLYPYISDPPTINDYAQVANLSSTTLGNGIFKDLMASHIDSSSAKIPASSSGFCCDVSFHGKMCFVSAESEQIRSLFLQSGDSLFSGSQPMIICNHPLDIAFENINPGVYEGYSSDSGIVSLFSNQQLRIVNGNAAVIHYDQTLKLNRVRFFSSGNFRMEPANGSESRGGNSPYSIVAYPNPSLDGLFTILISSPLKTNAVLTVSDLNGKILRSRKIIVQNGISQFRVDLEESARGEYLLKVSGSGFNQAVKITRK
jgi:hypothetical protein